MIENLPVIHIFHQVIEELTFFTKILIAEAAIQRWSLEI